MPHEPEPWPQRTTTAHAMSLHAVSPAAARVMYGRKAIKSLITKALTWPWRTEGGGVMCMGVAAGCTVLGVFINPTYILVGTLVNLPWIVQGLAGVRDVLTRAANETFEREIREIAYKDGVTVDHTQEERP